MKIILNQKENRFEARFQSEDWQTEKNLAQAAGFKCLGPPYWIWQTNKAKVLTKLKENRPAVLTITKEALSRYQELVLQDEKNAEVKRQLKEAKKKQKLEQPEEEQTESNIYNVEKTLEEIQQMNSIKFIFKPADGTCSCGKPVYFPEKLDPPTCLDCEFPD